MTIQEQVKLLPCPFCGENIIKHQDHHGYWYAHRNETGICIVSFLQLFDKKDYDAWNTRSPNNGTN